MCLLTAGVQLNAARDAALDLCQANSSSAIESFDGVHQAVLWRSCAGHEAVASTVAGAMLAAAHWFLRCASSHRAISLRN